MKPTYKILLGPALIALGACSNDNMPDLPVDPTPQNPYIEIISELPEGKTFSFDSNGNTTKPLMFNTNAPWKINVTYMNPEDPDFNPDDFQNQEDASDSSDAEGNDWATVFMREGEPGDSILVTLGAAENASYERRRAYFTILCGDVHETFMISQAQKNAVIITDPDAFKQLPQNHQIIEVEFGTNVEDYEWVVNTGANGAWIKEIEPPTKTRSMFVEKKAYFEIDENASFNQRNATIEIHRISDKNIKHTMGVVQTGLPRPTLVVNNTNAFCNLSNDKHVIDLDYSATNVNDASELELYISKDDQEWIHFATEKNKTTGLDDYQLTIDANETGDREAKVQLRSTIDNRFKKEWTISQNRGTGVTVNIDNKAEFRNGLDYKGGVILLKISADASSADDIVVNVTYPDGEDKWISKIQKNGASQVIMQFDENPAMKGRSAVVQISTTGGSRFDKLVLNQIASEILRIKSGQSLKNAFEENGLDPETVSKLVIRGRLSKDDLAELKSMATDYALTSLDMADVDPDSEWMQFTGGDCGGSSNGQFSKCTRLKHVVTPKNLKEIERNFFRGCTALETIVISEGTEVIHRHMLAEVFDGHLKDVYFPSTLKYAHGYVFDKVKAFNLHLASKPIQWENIVRDPTQPQTFCPLVGVNPNRPDKIYVADNVIEYYTNPSVDHIIGYYQPVIDVINQVKADPSLWTQPMSSYLGNANQDYLRLNNGKSLKQVYSWPQVYAESTFSK